MKNTYTIITRYSYRNHNYSIVKIENHFCAIDNELVGADGRILKELNGLQMHANESLEGCKEGVRNALDLEYYQLQGMSKAEAFCKIFPSMDITVARQVFGE